LGRLLLWSLLGTGLALAVGGLWLSAEQAQSLPREVAGAPASSTTVAASAVDHTPLAALIENTTPTAVATPTPSQDSPLKTLQEAPSSPPVVQISSPPAPQVTRIEPPAKPKPPADARRPRQAADNDVALLQAMFEHSSQNQSTTRSAGQELARQCGALSGDEAQACRARVCRKFPQAKVCR
jgi:hypothetical protein